MSALPTGASVYAACRTKRPRATKAEMEAMHAAIAQIVAQFQPCSVRQGFYQAEVSSIVEKTERGYEKVQRGIVWLRQSRRIPFGWISDATRWMKQRSTLLKIVVRLRACGCEL